MRRWGGGVAGADGGVRSVLQWGVPGGAVRGGAAGETGVGRAAGARGDDGGDDGVGGREGDREGGGYSWAGRGGEDGDDVGLSGRVVCWVGRGDGDWGLAGE